MSNEQAERDAYASAATVAAAITSVCLPPIALTPFVADGSLTWRDVGSGAALILGVGLPIAFVIAWLLWMGGVYVVGPSLWRNISANGRPNRTGTAPPGQAFPPRRRLLSA